MTIEPPPQDQPRGVLAVLQALVAQLLAMVGGTASRREIAQRLVSFEIQLVLALFGGGLASDPRFVDAPADVQRGWRRGLGRDLARLREIRIRLHRASTVRGHGYRRNPATMIAIRFERRIAARRVRRLGCARLAFVASTRETLAGAPP